jgi:hypothetical protein
MVFSTGTFDHVTPNEPQHGLPLRLNLTPDRGRTVARLLLIVPGLSVLLAPAALATYLIMRGDPSVLARHDPFVFAALAAQPALWVLLFTIAMMAVLPRLGRQRVVTLTLDHVSVLEQGMTGTTAWRVPTSSYRGIAHHVRATPGVVSHEIILVHDNPERSVLLHTSPMVNQRSLDHYCNLLQLPLVPSREVYRMSSIRGRRFGLAWSRRSPVGSLGSPGLAVAGGRAS